MLVKYSCIRISCESELLNYYIRSKWNGSIQYRRNVNQTIPPLWSGMRNVHSTNLIFSFNIFFRNILLLLKRKKILENLLKCVLRMSDILPVKLVLLEIPLSQRRRKTLIKPKLRRKMIETFSLLFIWLIRWLTLSKKSNLSPKL